MTKLADKPVRVYRLPCGHEKKSRAGWHSKVVCDAPGCSWAGAVTREMIAEADSRTAGKENTGRAKTATRHEVPASAAESARWQPEPIDSAAFTRSAGACKCGQPRAWPRRGRGTMAACPSCGAWSLPPNVLHAHSAAAGNQQARTSQQRDDDNGNLYDRIRELRIQAREYLADPEVPEAAKGRLDYLLDELETVRRTRNAARLAELEDLAAGLDLGFEEITYDEDDEIVEGEIVDDDEPAPDPPPPRTQLPPLPKQLGAGGIDYLAWTKPRPEEPSPPTVLRMHDQPQSRPAVPGGILPRIARERGLDTHEQAVAKTLATSLRLYDATRSAAAEGRALTGQQAMQEAGLYDYVPPKGKPVRRPRGFSRGGQRVMGAASDREPDWQARWDAAATARARGQRR